MLTFPIHMTWPQIAALPNAADVFCWDASEDETLAERIEAYSTSTSTKLDEYLTLIGFFADVDGVAVRSVTALETAHALFNQILVEYDEPDCPRVSVERYGHMTEATPTWALFGLGGDDDVDYNGSQPSCLTELLLQHCKEG